MKTTEQNKQEADRQIKRYERVDDGLNDATEHAIKDRQSVLEENKSVLTMLALHGDERIRLPIYERITNLTEQINYLQSKL